MIIETLITLFNRDLKKLVLEIEAYQFEDNMWKIKHDIKNSAGNLSLHIIGNLKTYIGNGLAKTDYIRDREFEFSGKNLSRDTIIKEIKETNQIVSDGLNSISPKDLDKAFPILIWEEETKMLFTLIHLHSHLNYHLGQINYHRRIFDIL